MSTKITSSTAKKVMDRLKKKAPPKRTKRTLVLTESSYIEFEKLCRGEGKYPSEVLDEFIQVFVEEMK